MDLEPQIGADYSQIDAEGFDLLGVSEKRDRYADYPLADLTRAVIGAALEVHRVLGHGFLEKVYERALMAELMARDVAAVAQAPIAVQYKGATVGTYVADLLVDGSVICEIKAVEGLGEAHQAQLLHYLKATGLPVGLLLNFGAPSLQVKRMVRTRERNPK